MVRVYKDNLLVMNKIDFFDHMKILDKVLHNIAEAGLKLNTENFILQAYSS